MLKYNDFFSIAESGFKPLSKLATRIMNAVIATDTTSEVNENVKALVRKIQGKRANFNHKGKKRFVYKIKKR